jgi:hypothetical protein
VVIREDETLTLFIDNMPVYFTAHVNNEMDKYNKNRFFVAEIIEKGAKNLTSKAENKYESRLRIGSWTWIVAYAEDEDLIVVIHLGKER